MMGSPPTDCAMFVNHTPCLSYIHVGACCLITSCAMSLVAYDVGDRHTVLLHVLVQYVVPFNGALMKM